MNLAFGFRKSDRSDIGVSAKATNVILNPIIRAQILNADTASHGRATIGSDHSCGQLIPNLIHGSE